MLWLVVYRSLLSTPQRPEIVKRKGVALPWIAAGVCVFFLFVSPDLFRQGDIDRTTAVKAQMQQLLTALEVYEADIGAFPTEEQGLQALRADPGVRGWNGPYVQKDIPLDPWGMLYRYTVADGRPHLSTLGGGSPRGKMAISSDGLAPSH
jgi:general secretion pathway protein G